MVALKEYEEERDRVCREINECGESCSYYSDCMGIWLNDPDE